MCVHDVSSLLAYKTKADPAWSPPHTDVYTHYTYYMLVLGGINILLPVYGITNSKRYSVFHGILINIL